MVLVMNIIIYFVLVILCQKENVFSNPRFIEIKLYLNLETYLAQVMLVP